MQHIQIVPAVQGAHVWSNRLVPRESAVALRQRSEGRHKARIDERGRVLSCRRLAPVETRLPRTGDGFSERRTAPPVVGLDDARVSMAMHSARASFAFPPVDEAAVPRRTDAHAETGMPRVHRGVYTVIR